MRAIAAGFFYGVVRFVYQLDASEDIQREGYQAHRPIRFGELFGPLGFASVRTEISRVFRRDLGAGGDGKRLSGVPGELFPKRGTRPGAFRCENGQKHWVNTENAGRRALVVLH